MSPTRHAAPTSDQRVPDGAGAASTGGAVPAPIAAVISALVDRAGEDRRQLLASVADGDRRGRSPWRSLVAAGVDIATLERVVWHTGGYDELEIDASMVDPRLFDTLPLAVARSLGVLPVREEDGTVTVAVADPGDPAAFDELRRRFDGLAFDLGIASRADIESTIETFNGLEVFDDGEDEPEDPGAVLVEDGIDDGRVARLVMGLIERAISARASDIHLEPNDQELSVRFRIDGVLHSVMAQPLELTQRVVNRLKVQARLDVAERRVPQDGRFQIDTNGRSVDLRIVTIPTVAGVEGAVLRILDRNRKLAALGELGFDDTLVERLHVAAGASQGAVLATGPTGSGKTTSMYALLACIDAAERKVVTIEDPVEYRFDGITQTQVNPKGGLSFARALRSFLRADPDVILVGEVRDGETARTSIESALTGHLVLATLHTRSAAAAVSRLLEIGVESYLVASAVRYILCQRLVRTVCSRCRQRVALQPQDLAGFGVEITEPAEAFAAAPGGCSACAQTGYWGRTAVGELIVVTPEIERAVADHANRSEIEDLASDTGVFVPLRENAARQVLKGATTLAEVGRVLS